LEENNEVITYELNQSDEESPQNERQALTLVNSNLIFPINLTIIIKKEISSNSGINETIIRNN